MCRLLGRSGPVSASPPPRLRLEVGQGRWGVWAGVVPLGSPVEVGLGSASVLRFGLEPVEGAGLPAVVGADLLVVGVVVG